MLQATSYGGSQKVHTHRSFKGIHLTRKCLNLSSVFIGLLLGHSQSLIIPGCGFGEVSKLAATGTNREKREGEERNQQFIGGCVRGWERANMVAVVRRVNKSKRGC